MDEMRIDREITTSMDPYEGELRPLRGGGFGVDEMSILDQSITKSLDPCEGEVLAWTG